MRILWIAPNGGRFDLESQKGGGWISSLEKALVETYPDIELGIAFLSENYSEPVGRDNVTYFPVFKPPVGKCKRLWNRLRRRTEEEVLLKGFEKVANAYNPDLLQIWGAEHFHIKLAKSLKYPQVVHIQGFASVISHYYLPFGVSVNDLKKCDGIINRILKRGYSYSYNCFLQRAETEKEYSQYVKNWIGRTEWDKSCAYILNPSAKYYHCDELMRDDFNGEKWNYHFDGVIRIQSSISEEWYKGVDIVIRTAKILKEAGCYVQWHIYGVSQKSAITKYFLSKYNCNPKNDGLIFHGKVKSDVISKGLRDVDVYVHPSYIENSSNAIVEAQLVGTPVIAQYVGGNPTMLNEESGILVPCNDPNMMAYAILQMTHKEIAEKYSKNEREHVAKKSKEYVLRDLMNIYHEVIKSEGISLTL